MFGFILWISSIKAAEETSQNLRELDNFLSQVAVYPPSMIKSIPVV